MGGGPRPGWPAVGSSMAATEMIDPRAWVERKVSSVVLMPIWVKQLIQMLDGIGILIRVPSPLYVFMFSCFNILGDLKTQAF